MLLPHPLGLGHLNIAFLQTEVDRLEDSLPPSSADNSDISNPLKSLVDNDPDLSSNETTIQVITARITLKAMACPKVDEPGRPNRLKIVVGIVGR